MTHDSRLGSEGLLFATVAHKSNRVLAFASHEIGNVEDLLIRRRIFTKGNSTSGLSLWVQGINSRIFAKWYSVWCMQGSM